MSEQSREVPRYDRTAARAHGRLQAAQRLTRHGYTLAYCLHAGDSLSVRVKIASRPQVRSNWACSVPGARCADVHAVIGGKQVKAHHSAEPQ